MRGSRLRLAVRAVEALEGIWAELQRANEQRDQWARNVLEVLQEAKGDSADD